MIRKDEALDVNQGLVAKLQILIVDRDPMGSDLLATALTREGKYDARPVPANLLIAALSSNTPDLVVIGAEFGSRTATGVGLTEKVHNIHPNLGIVVLLNEASEQHVLSAFRAGAHGVFCRTQPISEFLSCVDHVGRGRIWAGKHESFTLLEAIRRLPSLAPLTTMDSPGLNPRELQVVQHAAKGKTNKAIANDLGLSEHTVKNYLFRAFGKLGVSSRVELLFYLTQRGHIFGQETSTPDPIEEDPQ